VNNSYFSAGLSSRKRRATWSAIRAGPCVVNGAESRAFIVLVELLVEGIGVAWGSAIPLLLLYDPGLWASVGVSKPAGASVAGCCAIPANPTAITPSSNTRTETHLCIIAFHLLKSGFVETHPVPIKGLPGEMQDHMRSRFIPNSFVEMYDGRRRLFMPMSHDL
jgi:hypothetical protein